MKKCKICGKQIFGQARKYCPECKLKVHLSQMKKYYNNNKDEYLKIGGKYIRDNQKCLGRVYGENHWMFDKSVSKETRKKMSKSSQGDKNSQWQGGITDQKYCYKFNNQLREQIREKYNNCDYISGIHKDICNPNKKLSVHHINYDKDCGCNDVKCKLIPLSNSNHSKTNQNRSFWNRLFIYSLQYEKEYYGDE